MGTENGPWMPMYWGDYFGDTMHLTTEEHGAYLLLIGTYWRRGQPLPDDNKWLASASKLSIKKWKIIRPKIAEFFDVLDGEWTHKRVIKEALRSNDRITSARTAGIASATARRERADQPTTTTVTKKEEAPPLVPPQGGPTQETTDDDKPKPAKRGTRLPDNWQPSPDAREFAKERGYVEAQFQALAEGFRAYHGGVKKGTSKDWEASFRMWVLNDIAFHGPPETRSTQHGQAVPGDRGFTAAAARFAASVEAASDLRQPDVVPSDGNSGGQGQGQEPDSVHHDDAAGESDLQGTGDVERADQKA